MRHIFGSIRNALKRIIPFLISMFLKLSAYWASIIVLSLVIVGQIIHFYYPLKHFNAYQILVSTAIIVAFWAIRKFLVGFEEFKQMTASHPIKFVGINILKLIRSEWSIPGILIIGGLFIYSSFRLQYIQLDLIGVYALVMIILMITTAVFGQTIYVYHIILLNQLNQENAFKYNFYMPAKTDWIVRLAKNGRMLNNSFFILGFIYTVVYYLNMPPKSISINHLVNGSFGDRISISTPDNLIFIMSWVAIFIIIIVAFPTYYFIQKNYIKSLVRRLKDLSIKEVQKLMKAQDLTGVDNIDSELKYFNLINNIENSPITPLKGYGLIPIISTLSSLSVHFIKISESLL